MSDLRTELGNYLAIRRALGFKLRRAELLLADFVGYMEANGADTITTGNAFRLGQPARQGQLGLVGLPALGGAGLRSSPACHRSNPRSAPDRPAPGKDPSGHALLVLGRGDRRTHGCRCSAPLAAAVRVAGLPRSAKCRPARTTCATASRCAVSPWASIPPSSRSGSATRASRPPRSTCTPTSSPRNERWRGRRPPTPSPVAIVRRTRSSPSSKASDYADCISPTLVPQGLPVPTRHNPLLGIMHLC